MQHNISQPEQWRDIPGYEGMYQVSDQGGVRGLDRHVLRSDGVTRFQKGRPLTPVADKDGYPKLPIYKDGKGVTYRVHRLVLETFVGPCPEGMEACHNNGNRKDNRLENLRWDTPEENKFDKFLGRGAKVSPLGKALSCPWGHSLIDPNLVAGALRRGHKMCKACHQGRAQARRHGLMGQVQELADDRYRKIMNTA